MQSNFKIISLFWFWTCSTHYVDIFIPYLQGEKNLIKVFKFFCFSGESSEDAVAQLQKQDTLKISFETVLQEGTQKRYDDDIETKDKVTLFETEPKQRIAC